MATAIQRAEAYERDAIISLIIEDLAEAISKLYNAVDEKHKKEIREKLARILGS
jgi:hypothetical protein